MCIRTAVDLGYRVIDDGDDSKVVGVRCVGVVIVTRLSGHRALALAQVEEPF
jgi:hypothetical protein